MDLALGLFIYILRVYSENIRYMIGFNVEALPAPQFNRTMISLAVAFGVELIIFVMTSAFIKKQFQVSSIEMLSFGFSKYQWLLFLPQPYGFVSILVIL